MRVPASMSCAEMAIAGLHSASAWHRAGKGMVPFVGRYLFLNRAFRAHRRHLPLVLCYHSVVPDKFSEDPFDYGNVVSVTEFSEQMALLVKSMRPISPGLLLRWLAGSAEIPRDSVLVTFDDGYRNNLTHAAPILARLKIPALLFVSVGYIGGERLLWPTDIYRRVLLWRSNSIPLPDGSMLVVPATETSKRIALATWIREFCKSIPDAQRKGYLDILCDAAVPMLTQAETEMFSFLSWEELRRLHEMGFDIGSHTSEHCILTRIPPCQVAVELAGSKQRIEEKLRAPCLSLAYPNGTRADYSPAVVSAAKEAGYQVGFTTKPGSCIREGSALTIDRVCVPGKLSRDGFRSRMSSFHDEVKRTLVALQRAS